MGKTGWQAVAFFAIAWAVAASAIAWVNKGQIEQRAEHAVATDADSDLRRTLGDLQRRNDALTAELGDRDRAALYVAPVDPHARCIGGVRFHTVDGELRNGGAC